MEITLMTKNGITPNPTIEFLEVCNAAVLAITQNSPEAIVELETKFTDLFKEDVLTSIEKRWEFGRLSITIVYAVRDGKLQHRFFSHYDNIHNCPSNSNQLNPVIYAY